MTTAVHERPAVGDVTCGYHTNVKGTWVCSQCGSTFCDDCMQEGAAQRRQFDSCPRCRGFCRTLVLAGPSRPKSFGDVVAKSVSYPLTPSGIAMVALGAAFFTFLGWLAGGIHPGIALFFAIFATGYLAAYMFTILNVSSRGEEDLPAFPEYTDFYDSILVPFFQFAFAVVLCYSPVAAPFFMFGVSPFAFLVAFVGMVAGSLYLPMALLSIAMNGSIAGMNPSIVLPNIRAVPGPYLAACAIMFVLMAISTVTQVYLENTVPIIGTALSSFVSLYMVIVEMRLLGLIYFTHQDRFQLF